ncbi:MAG: hypothetical protein LAO78_22500 [Acidobacteriia bacterium]|nr:hypothetical protein [Terriglobia bacterium]
MLFYLTCWTEDDGIYSCGHEHLTIREALECLVPDGKSFIRARDNGRLRSLNDAEFGVFLVEVTGGILKGKS